MISFILLQFDWEKLASRKSFRQTGFGTHSGRFEHYLSDRNRRFDRFFDSFIFQQFSPPEICF